MGKTIEVICAYCGLRIEKKEKNVNPRLKIDPEAKFYCNRSCAGHGPKLTFKCGTCGEEIKRTPSQLSKSKSGIFYCNKSCAAKSNNPIGKLLGKKHPNYVDGYSSYREANLKNRCEECGEDRAYLLVVHHKNGDRRSNNPENLETLCRNCHACRHLVVKNGKIVIRWKSLTSEEAKNLLVNSGAVA